MKLLTPIGLSFQVLAFIGIIDYVTGDSHGLATKSCDTCKSQCEAKKFEYVRCDKGVKYSDDPNIPANIGDVTSYCICNGPPCSTGQERCIKEDRLECKSRSGEPICMENSLCGCSCDAKKCDEQCKNQFKADMGNCVDDVTYGHNCQCIDKTAKPCSPDQLRKCSAAFKDFNVQYAKDNKGLLCKLGDPVDICELSCDGDSCKNFCKKQDKIGTCKAFNTNKVYVKGQGFYCKCEKAKTAG